MKKVLVIFICVLVAFSLLGCEEKNTSFSTYTVIGIENNRTLLVEGAKKKDINTLTNGEILEKYKNGVWLYDVDFFPGMKVRIWFDETKEFPKPGFDSKYAVKIGNTGEKIRRFDTIVFDGPGNTGYIKRVIGLPKETLYYEGDVLYINDEPIEEKYLESLKKEVEDGPYTDPFTLDEKIGTNVIPEGHVFVLGDYRRFSKDSRHIGTIPIDDVLGTFLPIEKMIIID